MYQLPNPVNDFYFRNAQMQQGQFVPQNQQYSFPQTQQAQLITRYVTNIEEARAAMIDALNTYIFLDQGSGRIYVKKMNNNGLSDFFVYAIEEQKQNEKTDPMQEINARLLNIENFIGGLRSDKSVSDNADVTKSARSTNATTAKQNEPNAKAESGNVYQNAGNDKRQE